MFDDWLCGQAFLLPSWFFEARFQLTSLVHGILQRSFLHKISELELALVA